jgi:TolB-like protein
VSGEAPESGDKQPGAVPPPAGGSTPTSHGVHIEFKFLEQLKHRNIGRVAILYVVVCYLILESFSVFIHVLGLPEWIGRTVAVLMVLGFPAALIFAWVYELTPEGLKPAAEVDPHKSIRAQTGQRLNRAIIAVMAVALGYFIVDKFWISKHFQASQAVTSAPQETTSRANGAPASSTPTTAAPAAAAAFAPPPRSIAVLPFVNMSGDKEQEYFSDGLTEELLNSLSRINELQVAARTSSFSFQGEHPDISTVAHKLNVAAVLEGSVRRSAHTLRITAQLVNGVTGFHLWSQTYDRDLGNVLALQTEIANAVASALKVTLLGDVAAKIELGGTRNPAAFDAYLRGSKAYINRHEAKDVQTAIDAFTEAIRLDPNYALAFVARSSAFNEYAEFWASRVAASHEGIDKALADGQKATLLAPELGEGHLALAVTYRNSLDFARASKEYERAVALASGNARALQDYGNFAVLMGRTDQGIAAAHRAVLLDPLNRDSHRALGETLRNAHHYDEAIAAFQDALALDLAYSEAYAFRGLARYALGDFQGARASCEMKTGNFTYYLVCLAIAYDKLGRHADAEAMLAKLQTWMGDNDAFQYAEIYSQWGSTNQALEWLETALRLRDAGLGWLRTDPLLDPLRKEPRFQAIERALKFPN